MNLMRRGEGQKRITRHTRVRRRRTPFVEGWSEWIKRLREIDVNDAMSL